MSGRIRRLRSGITLDGCSLRPHLKMLASPAIGRRPRLRNDDMPPHITVTFVPIRSISAMTYIFKKALQADPPEARASFKHIDRFIANTARQAPGE